MKKAKKLLSLFLAALMLMSCFGAIGASALTMDEAEAAAVEFNAAQVDHSDIYQNMSAKQWASMKGTLNATVGAVLDAVKLEETIYSDATINTLMSTLGSALSNSIDLLAGAMGPYKSGEVLGDAYAENAAILMAGGEDATWDDVAVDSLVWNVTPGNADEFAVALEYALSGTLGNAMQLIGLLRATVYTDTIVPIVESLHAGKMQTIDEIKAAGFVQADVTTIHYWMHALSQIIVNVIDSVLANPVEYLTEILPDFFNSFAAGMSTIKNDFLLKLLAPDLVAMVPDNLSSLIPTIVPMIPSLLGLGEDYVMPALNLPEIDENSLIHMGEAYAAESGMADGYRMAIAGDSTMVFAAVAQYVQEVLQDKGNQTAIGDLIVAKVGPEYLDNYREIVNAATNGTSLDVADACLSLLEEYLSNNGAQEETNPILAFFAKVVEFFQKIVAFIERLFGIR